MAIYLGTSKLASVAIGTVDASGTSITLATPVLTLDNNTGMVIATVTQNTSGHLQAGSTSNSLSLPTQSTITATPSNSTQTIVSAGKFTLGPIKVGAVQTETKSITSNGTYTPSSGKYFSSVTVNVPTGSTINNQNKTITPTTSQQQISADSGYSGLGIVTVNAIPSNYIIPSGNYSITSNGTNINIAQYATVSVNVPNSGSTINNQNKTVTPTTSQQTITADSGYTGLGTVTVNAMPTMTLPTAASASATSGFSSKATIGRSTADQYINIPTGYNSAGAYYKISAVPNGAVNNPIATKGTVSNNQISITPSVTSTTGYITGGTKTGTAVTVSASELVSGNLAITSNGTNINVTNYATVSVNVASSGTTINNQNKTVTPTESQQSISADNGYTGLGTVTVNAISSIYVGSGIAQRSSSDLTVSGATVTAPAGYYASNASKSVASMTLPTAASSSSSGTSKATIGRSTSAQYINIPVGYNSAAAYYTISATPNMILPTAAATSSSGTAKLTITPTTSARYINIPTGYNGTASYYTIAGDADLIPGNIKNGVEIFGVTGNYTAQSSTPNLQAKTGINPSTSSQTITADSGYDGLSSVQINAMTTMTLPTTLATSAASGYTRVATVDRSTSIRYINIPAGYHSGNEYYQISAVANGSATPQATISGTSATVSTGTNTLTLTQTLSLTPQVTAGYIAAGTTANRSVSLRANVTTKAAATITPGTTNQTIASGTYLTGTQTISGDANLVAGNIKSGVSIFGVAGSYEGSGGGSSKNIQVNSNSASINYNGYRATTITLTVAKTGTYNVSWMAWRSSSSGTMGTRLYRNSTQGTAQQTWTNTYGQHITLTNQSYTAGDVLTLYATSGSSSRYCWVGNLIIEEQ